MLKQKSFQDTITEIRVLITKPVLKSTEESRKAFKDYLRDTHNISDIKSKEGHLFLNNLRQWKSTQEILKYMGY